MATIRMLNSEETLSALPDLCDILSDCVNGGASVGFMLPFTDREATAFWQKVAKSVGNGDTIHVAAEMDGKIVGTVQVGLADKPNQPHRGDLMKLLVHRRARGLGLSRKLTERAEAEAIYPRLGWQHVGIIPDYALFPDGRYCDTTIFYKRIGQVGSQLPLQKTDG